MSFVFIPNVNVFFGLPVNDRSKIFARGHIIKDKGDATNKASISKILAEYQDYAESITRTVRHKFNPDQVIDLIERPCIAVIADGATLHLNARDEEQRDLQAQDSEAAFALGSSLAKKGFRVVLPGYLGLCESVIEGIRAEGGHYIVSMTRRSVQFDDYKKPLLPPTDGHGMYVVTNTLAESKSVLFALTNNFIYLTGGLNTLDIFTDQFTLIQTKMSEGYRLVGNTCHEMIISSISGFWNVVHDMMEHILDEEFADRTSKKDDSKILRKADSIDEAMQMAEATLCEPEAWPVDLFKQAPSIYMPSRAITLASDLSRQLVIEQIVPVESSHLLQRLNSAKRSLKGGEPLDEALRPFIDNQNVAVYCGSRLGKNPRFKEAALAVGALLYELNFGIVYGGSVKGIMGAVADGAIDAAALSGNKANILAITPFRFLNGTSNAANEGFHSGISATIGVPGMQERKMLMTAMSDVSIMLPGGWGSLDETLEEIRLNLLGVDGKKIIIFNVDGYWDKFPTLFSEAIRRGYMQVSDLDRIQMVKTLPELRSALLEGAQNAPASNPVLVPV